MKFSRITLGALAIASPCTSSLVLPDVPLEYQPYENRILTRDNNISNNTGAASNVTSIALSKIATSEVDLVEPEWNSLTNFSSHGAPQVSDSLDPVKDWEDNKHFNHKYWTRSKESTLESDTVGFFRDFNVEYFAKDPHACRAKGLSLPQCFQYVYLGNSNYACSKYLQTLSKHVLFCDYFTNHGSIALDNPHLCEHPTPQTVMAHLSSHWTDLSSAELVTLGRQVFFTSEIMHAMMSLDHRFFVSLLRTLNSSESCNLIFSPSDSPQ